MHWLSRTFLLAFTASLIGCSSHGAPGREQTSRLAAASATNLPTDATWTWIEDQAPTVGWQLASGKPRALAASAGRLAVGVPDDDSGKGAVYLYERSGPNWTPTWRLPATPCDVSPCGFGETLAASDDTIVVGTLPAAKVDVFSSVGPGNWASQQLSGGGSGLGFGKSVAISGNTIVVGAPLYFPTDSPSDPAAYVFAREAGAWTLQATLSSDRSAPNVTGRFGYSVAIDADTIVVGEPGSSVQPNVVHVFSRYGSSWLRQQVLTLDTSGDEVTFGDCVAVSGDTIAIEANRYYGPRWAYLFVRNGSAWTLQEKVKSSFDMVTTSSDCSLSLSGNTLAYSFRSRNGNSPAGSAVEIFSRIAGAWVSQLKWTTEDPLARAVAALDEEVLATGDAVRDFWRSGPTWREQPALIPSWPTTTVQSVSASGSRLVLGTPNWETQPQVLNIDVFSRFGSVWLPEQHLEEKLIEDARSASLYGNSLVINTRPRIYRHGPDGWGERQELVQSTGTDHLDSAYVVGNTAFMDDWRQAITWVFAYDGSSWVEQGTLQGRSATGELHSLYKGAVISGDLALLNGTVEVPAYVRSGSVLSFEQMLSPEEPKNSNADVYLSGRTALIHWSGESLAYLYEHDEQGWHQRYELDAGHELQAGDVVLSDNVGFIGPDLTLVKVGNEWRRQEAVLPPLHYWPDPFWAPFGSSLSESGDTLVLASGRTSHVFHRQARSAPGSACRSANDCSSGTCSHGICCNQACGGKCEACVNYLTDLDDGTCGPVRAGTRCGADLMRCVSRTLYATAPTCDASGNCLNNTVECGDGAACAANGAHGFCALDCIGGRSPDHSLCDDAHFCAADPSRPGKGVCRPDLPAGAQCETGEQCVSGVCTTSHWCAAGRGERYSDTVKCAGVLVEADGVCCERPCTGVCESCNQPSFEGTCKPKKGDPEAGHGTCAGADEGCDGECDGNVGSECQFPGSVRTCSLAACVGTVSVLPRQCDGHGRCGAAQTQDCAPRRCDTQTGLCKQSCATPNDCVSGSVCNSDDGTCSPIAPRCKGRSTVVLPDGSEHSCNGYACDTGGCKEVCSDNRDCAADFECSSRQCVVTKIDAGVPAGNAQASADGCSCIVAGAPSTVGSAFASGAAVAIAILRRTIRRRRGSRQRVGI